MYKAINDGEKKRGKQLYLYPPPQVQKPMNETCEFTTTNNDNFTTMRWVNGYIIFVFEQMEERVGSLIKSSFDITQPFTIFKSLF